VLACAARGRRNKEEPLNSADVKYCPRCGTPLGRGVEFGRDRPRCPNCGWIYFADPKVAAAVLLRKESRVLLVRRVNEPFRGGWTLPAGFVDADEDPARAAERECLEETGLTVRATSVLQVIAGREHPRGADFIIVYAGEIISGEARPGDDADQVEWFDRRQLPNLAFRATETVLRNL
jgi:ADP-ribose pyrophosphatase YjhB (NUDIX family)